MKNNLEYRKRQYKKALLDLQVIIKTELEIIDDDNTFEPASSVEFSAYRVVQESNQFKGAIDQNRERIN